MIRQDPNRKYGSNAYLGPYRVTSVRNNGTLRYRKCNIKDTINIQNVSPYLEPDPR